jgi:diguanylate cyclase (GGDEF)-like protein
LADSSKKGVPSLNLVDDGILVKRLELDGRDRLLGRGPGCDLVLGDKLVSRHHARIYLSGGRWQAEDLDSTNGLLVNGARIKRRALRHGDELGLGAVTLVYDDGRGLELTGEATCAEKPGQETVGLRRQFDELGRKLGGRGEARDLQRLRQTAERSRRKLKDLASRDRLTGLCNRRRFEQEMERLWRESAGSRCPLSLVFIDLDHFKRINDVRGHQAGDRALKAAARLIRAACRRDDLVARYGGEEFVAAFPGMGAGDAAAAAESIRKLVEGRSSELAGFAVTASLGVACRNTNDRAWQDLVRRADAAVYRAKAGGRNRVAASDG